jgi:hypothetical protein
MTTYVVYYQVPLNVYVTIEAEDEDSAADESHGIAEAYLQTVYGNGRDVDVEASLDGLGAESVTERDGDAA